MILLAEAQAHVLGGVRPLPVRSVPARDALGLVLAEDVAAPEDVPPFPNTAMDGYAVRAADTRNAAEHPVLLAVVGEVAAGADARTPVGSGEAVRIMTGAPMPPGADAVVMVEATERQDGDGDGPERVVVHVAVTPGQHVRPAGDDVTVGRVLAVTGTRLGPGHIGVLAAAGVTKVLCFDRPRVGVLSTGDELVDDGRPLEPGAIRESNRPALAGLVAAEGYEAVDLGTAPDDPVAIEAGLRDAVGRCDAVITSGGVSMGDYDYVKVVLDRIGEMRWMQVAIRPAKPLAFGAVSRDHDGVAVPVFGLPGNPVSSMVSFELFARPALRRMAGHLDGDLHRRPIVGVADEAIRRSPDGKTHFVRVRAAFGDDGRLHVRPTGGQGSHHLLAMAEADGLAVVADGVGVEAAGDVDVLLLR